MFIISILWRHKSSLFSAMTHNSGSRLKPWFRIHVIIYVTFRIGIPFEYQINLALRPTLRQGLSRFPRPRTITVAPLWFTSPFPTAFLRPPRPSWLSSRNRTLSDLIGRYPPVDLHAGRKLRAFNYLGFWGCLRLFICLLVLFCVLLRWFFFAFYRFLVGFVYFL